MAKSWKQPKIARGGGKYSVGGKMYGGKKSSPGAINGIPQLPTRDWAADYLGSLGAVMNSLPQLPTAAPVPQASPLTFHQPTDYSNLIQPVDFGGMFGGMMGGAAARPNYNIDVGFTPGPVYNQQQSAAATQSAGNIPQGNEVMGMNNIGGALGSLLGSFGLANNVAMGSNVAQANAAQNLASQQAAAQAGANGMNTAARMYGIGRNFNQGYQNALLQLLGSMMGGIA